MHVALITHRSCELHDTGWGHPERPARLVAATKGVRASGIPVLESPAPRVDPDLLTRVHQADYVRAIEAFCAAGGGSLDADTHAVPDSWEAALRAAGAGPAAIEALQSADDATAFLAVRPPGHHALVARAMGFCLFNNVAVAARRLLDEGQRVAVMDWDVHHGNGTEQMFETEPDVLYVSIHQHPFYPGTGWLRDLGSGGTAGTTVNVPVPAGTAGDVYRAACAGIVAPVIREFSPDWILVSAGFDAHADDPLAEVRLLASDYAHMASMVHSLVGPARVIYFLEGGYHLEAIEVSVAAALASAAGRTVPDEDERPESPPAAWRALEDARAAAAQFWRL